MKDFLSGAGVHVLDATTILDCVQKKSISDLGQQSGYTCCMIRVIYENHKVSSWRI